jgi:hypothetical protein
MLTGDWGIGRPTTIRRLGEELDPVRFKLLYLSVDSNLTPRHCYKGLLEQLGCEAKFYRAAPNVNCIGKSARHGATAGGGGG